MPRSKSESWAIGSSTRGRSRSIIVSLATALRRCVLLFGAQKVERGKEFLRESLSRLSKVEGGKEFLCEMLLAVANQFATAGAIHADLIGRLHARFICPHAVSIPHKDK